MNIIPGSKNFIKATAAEGIAQSRIIKTEKIQNIPNRALGNSIEAATKAFFKRKSMARMRPSETTQCSTPNT